MRDLLPLALITSSFASPVVLTLGNSPDENNITITATVNDVISDTATTVYTGTIETELSFTGSEVTTFEMTGGNITASDVSFLFEFFPIFPKPFPSAMPKVHPIPQPAPKP